MSHKLNQVIRERVGHNKAAADHYRAVVLKIHRELESSAVERNCALRDICDSFHVDQGFLTVRLRAGGDYDREKNFDLMAAYAVSHYPHLLFRSRRTESECGSAEEFLAKWAVEGLSPVPNAWDESVLRLADSAVGPAFWDGLEQRPSDAAIEKTLARLERYHDRVVEDIARDDRGEVSKVCWPKYRLTRLRNEIDKLPASVRDIAAQRSRLYEIEELVFEHVVPF